MINAAFFLFIAAISCIYIYYMETILPYQQEKVFKQVFKAGFLNRKDIISV